MFYCSSCGKETTEKICPHCGVKRGTAQNFCSWCGQSLSEGAAICTACHEPVKQKINPKKFWQIIGLILLLICTIISFNSSQYLCAVLSTLGFIAFLPFVGELIVKKTHNFQALRKIVMPIRTLLPIILFLLCIVTEPPNTDFYSRDAIKAAEVLFHEEHKLKNEASYVLNDATVSVSELGYPAFNEGHTLKNENIRLVIVELDVSAENSYGGMGRQTYKMRFYFNAEDGMYYRFDGTLIKFK